MDPGGTSGLLLISTEEILCGGAFIDGTCSEDCFYPNKTVRDPPFSPSHTNALKQHGGEAGVDGLWANKGYL